MTRWHVIALILALAACAWVGPADAGTVNWTADDCGQECYP